MVLAVVVAMLLLSFCCVVNAFVLCLSGDGGCWLLVISCGGQW